MPILVSTPQDLNNVRNNLSGEYELTNDIDMSGFGNFIPIGKSSPIFTGKFDGKGYKIKNLTINDTSNYTGLFGLAYTNSLIQNVALENCNIISTGEYVGALIGRSYGQVSNCYSTGTVSGYAQVGGLIGYSYNGIIQNCYSKCNVTGNNYLGGFIGHPGPNYSTSVVRNCYATGYVATATNSGGFAGFYDNTTVENCYFDKETTEHSIDPIATGLTTTQMKTQSTFTNWDFIDIWSIDNDYPYLQIYGSSAPSGSIEERQVISYLNDIYSSIKANKSVEKQVNSYANPIVSDTGTQKNKSIHINSYSMPIYANIISQNKINRIINVQSYMMPIKSNATNQVTGFRQPVSYMKIIDSKVILPGIILPFVCATSWYEQNISNSSCIENISNSSIIENPSHSEVMV